MPLTAGDKLGPYEILAAIGAGGMGQVYKARDTRLDRTVAIKVLPADKVARRRAPAFVRRPRCRADSQHAWTRSASVRGERDSPSNAA